MDSVISYIEFENQVISAAYRKLMIGATVVLVDAASRVALPEPFTRITAHLPAGTIRIRLPASLRAGTYFLRARNGHGEHGAQSVEFNVA